MELVNRSIFRAAIRAHVECLRAQLYHHPSLRELETFEADGLNPEHTNEVSEHLAICESCRAKLRRQRARVPAEFQDPTSEPGARMTRQELRQAWDELSRRLTRQSFPRRLLSEELAEGPMPVQEVLSLARRTTQALVITHSKGDLIRNLAPETVLLDSERDTVRFLDLGIGAPPGSLAAEVKGRTAEDVGHSLRCYSPEQIMGEYLDQQSNLFSLGAVLYELATGFAPFQGQTPMETAGRIMVLEVLPISSQRSEFPQFFDQLIIRMLKKEPAARPKSAAAVASALVAIEAGSQDPLRILDEDIDSDAEIETLYRYMDTLLQRSEECKEATLATEIDETMARLRALQRVEAERFQAFFEQRLAMPMDAGKQILARAKALRRKLESLTGKDPAAH